MGSLSLVHWMILLAVVLIFFGTGRLSSVMGDFAKGIKAFKAGMKEEEKPAEAPPASIGQTTTTAMPTGSANTVTSDHKIG